MTVVLGVRILFERPCCNIPTGSRQQTVGLSLLVPKASKNRYRFNRRFSLLVMLNPIGTFRLEVDPHLPWVITTQISFYNQRIRVDQIVHNSLIDVLPKFFLTLTSDNWSKPPVDGNETSDSTTLHGALSRPLSHGRGYFLSCL